MHAYVYLSFFLVPYHLLNHSISSSSLFSLSLFIHLFFFFSSCLCVPVVCSFLTFLSFFIIFLSYSLLFVSKLFFPSIWLPLFLSVFFSHSSFYCKLLHIAIFPVKFAGTQIHSYDIHSLLQISVFTRISRSHKLLSTRTFCRLLQSFVCFNLFINQFNVRANTCIST